MQFNNSTVDPVPTIILNHPADTILVTCDQNEINTAFSSWIGEFGFSGGCGM